MSSNAARPLVTSFLLGGLFISIAVVDLRWTVENEADEETRDIRPNEVGERCGPPSLGSKLIL